MIWPCKKNGSNKDTKKGITVLRKNLPGDPEQAGLVRYWKAPRRDETASKKSNWKDCEKREKMGHFPLINPCKMETITKDESNHNFNKTEVSFF